MGTRREIGAEILIGRGRDAALQLSDLGVSRRHLEVRPAKRGVRVTTVGDASPFATGGKLCTDSVVALGDRVVVGETALTFVSSQQQSAVTNATEITKLHTLLDDAAVDARGLAAIFDLGDALNAPSTEAQLIETVSGWARRAFRITARLEPAGGQHPQMDEMMQRMVQGV